MNGVFLNILNYGDGRGDHDYDGGDEGVLGLSFCVLIPWHICPPIQHPFDQISLSSLTPSVYINTRNHTSNNLTALSNL